MVCILEKTQKQLLVSISILLFSVVFFILSGISSDTILSPMGEMTNLLSGKGLEINYIYAVLSLLSFSLALALLPLTKKKIKTGLIVLNLLIALGVFGILFVNPIYTENAMADFSSGIMQMAGQSAQGMAEMQKQFAYQTLDAVETSLVSSMDQNIDAYCVYQFQSNLEQINAQSKLELDRQLEQIDLSSIPSDALTQIPLFDLIRKAYPITAGFSVWVVLEFLRAMIIMPLVGLYGFILGKIFKQKKCNK